MPHDEVRAAPPDHTLNRICSGGLEASEAYQRLSPQLFGHGRGGGGGGGATVVQRDNPRRSYSRIVKKKKRYLSSTMNL